MASAAASSLKEYLKRYQSGADAGDKRKKKKKKPKAPSSVASGVLIVDEDPSWQKPLAPDAPDADVSDSAGEDEPVVDEDIEVKRMRRLEAIRARKPYLSVSEDGSGWVSVPGNKGGDLIGSEPAAGVDSGSGDLSPPRQAKRRRFHTPSPGRRAGSGSSPDCSPRPRGVRRNSPEKNMSPPRCGRRGSVESPARGARVGSPDVDMSPPRRRRVASPGSDFSPPRRAQRSSLEADLSPPRRRSRRLSPAEDLSPPRVARRNSSEVGISLAKHAYRSSPGAVDLSPPRRAGRNSPESDLSPPRWGRGKLADLDRSPPRHGRSGTSAAHATRDHSSGEDLSPPRKSKRLPVVSRSGEPARKEMLPPRRRERSLDEKVEHTNLARSEHLSEKKDGDKPLLDEGRRKGGLYTGSQMKEEIERKKAENLARFESLDPIKSGKGAEPVFRHQGRRISKEEKLKLEKREEKPKEKKLEWGKGLAQKREAEAKILELELEKEKPFARTRDDPELDKMLKERVRWGDPMAHLVKKKDPEILLRDFGDDEKMKESGFIIPQTIPSHSWIKRGLDPPPNRYDIKPGRHWDGVDRSTGYEKELFKRQNEKRATQTEAYLWSVAEM